MTLVEFLRARIDEDAVAAAHDALCRPVYCLEATAHDEMLRLARDEGAAEAAVDFARRLTPARVLAECDAKRSIIAEWAEVHSDEFDRCDPVTGGTGMENHDGHADALAFVFRALALPYAEDPDYRNEWRP